MNALLSGSISTAVVSLAHGQRRRVIVGDIPFKKQRPEAGSKLGAFFLPLTSCFRLPNGVSLTAYAEQSFARFFTEY